MKACIKLLLLLLVSVNVIGQQNYADSLKRVLKAAQTDSSAYRIQTDLAFYYSENNRDSALYYADNCIMLAQKNNKKLDEARSLGMKGYVLMHLGRLPESYGCFPTALKIAEDPDNENKTWSRDTSLTPRKIRLQVLENAHHDFGHLMRSIGKTDQQIFQYKEAKRIAEEIGDTAMLGFVNMNMGSVYFGLGKLDSALTMEENAARIFIQTGNKSYLSHVYLLTGSLYLQKENKPLALQYFHKGIQSAIEKNNITTLIDCYFTLANFYTTREKNKDSCLYYSRKALSGLQSTGSRELGYAYATLSESYEMNEMIDSAFKYGKLAILSKDSSYQAEIESLTKVQKLTFDEQLRLQELEKEKTATKNKIRIYAMLAGLGVFLIIGFILYRNNRQKQKANSVLETTLSNLKSTQSQLVQSEKMASLGELTAGIAHEIQNPLNFVNNFAEVNSELIGEMKDELSKGNIDDAKKISDDIDENEKKIIFHGKRADAIVKGMLQHSRSSSGLKEPTDINALADEYLHLSYHGLRAKDKSFNATMKTDFDETIGKINIIPQDIGRVILNLLTNAFYVVDEKKTLRQAQGESLPTGQAGYEPTVSLSTKKLAGKVEIRVADNGNGIPQKVMDKIFQPFFTTKPTGQGTGLGLSLSYDIITKAHSGQLKVETKEGEGTTFIIILPI